MQILVQVEGFYFKTWILKSYHANNLL